MSAYDPNYYYQYYYTNGYILPQQQLLQIQTNHAANQHGNSCCHKPTCPNRSSCSKCNTNNCNSNSKISIKSEVCKSVKQVLTEIITSKTDQSKANKKTENDYKSTPNKSNESLNSKKYQNQPYEYEYYYNSKGQKVLRYFVKDESYLSGSSQSLNKEGSSANYSYKPRTSSEISSYVTASKESVKRDNDYKYLSGSNQSLNKNSSEYTNKPRRVVEYVYEEDYYNNRNNSTRKSSTSSLNEVPTTNSAFKSYYTHSSSASDLENMSRKMPLTSSSKTSNSSLKSILKNSTKKVEFNDYPSVRTIKPDRSISHEDLTPIAKSRNDSDSSRYRSELVIEPTRTKPAELIVDTSKLNESKTSSRSSSLSRRSRSTDDLFEYDGVPQAPSQIPVVSHKSETSSRLYTPNIYSSGNYRKSSTSSARESSEFRSKNYYSPQLNTSYQMHSENKNSLYPDLSFASKPLYRTLNVGKQPSETSKNEHPKVETEEDNHKIITGLRNVILSSPNKEEVHKNLNKGIRYMAKKILKN